MGLNDAGLTIKAILSVDIMGRKVYNGKLINRYNENIVFVSSSSSLEWKWNGIT